MARPRTNDAPALAAMADMLVAGKIDVPKRGRSSGIEPAAREVAKWTLFPKKIEDNEREVKRLSVKYHRNQPKLEAAARRRLESGEAAASLGHVTGLGCVMSGRGVAYHDSKLARLGGDVLAQMLGEALRAVDPDALRGAENCRELASILERQAEVLEVIAKGARSMAENFAD